MTDKKILHLLEQNPEEGMVLLMEHYESAESFFKLSSLNYGIYHTIFKLSLGLSDFIRYAFAYRLLYYS